ncbi:MAG: PIN domain-containing protein [Rhodospirillales bacterium]|nr:MAG: PIN domain-containing protein [Rhodospirillales bacterium]
MPFVVDASVTASWCFPDESHSAANSALRRLAEDDAVVPALWWFEVRNVLVVSERRGRIDAASSTEFISDLERLPIRIDRDPDSETILATARKHVFTVYDAAYLELARRLRAPIVTLDRALAAAARAEGVELIAGPAS